MVSRRIFSTKSLTLLLTLGLLKMKLPFITPDNQPDNQFKLAGAIVLNLAESTNRLNLIVIMRARGNS